MINPNALEAWLNSTNARYRADELPPRHRPFKALSDLSREFTCSVSLDSPVAKAIFDWFYKHSQPGAHAVGALFTGAYYFDACFWPLYIPIGYGTFSINALDCLETMPQPIKEHVNQSHKDLWDLALYWADCCDYAYGIDDISKQGLLNEKALAFIQNGDRELAGAIAQLVSPRPNAKAILALRMACEIFLKTLLIQERNLTDQQLKKLSHKIEDIAAECFAVTRALEFDAVAKTKGAFPDVSDRYDGVEQELSEVWVALCVTQIAATAVIRHYTDRDMRSQIFSPPKEGG
ncbi:MAG TPA: hypothetical protein VJ437_14020 [Acidiferrobacterales bacterium]|nr:hypothetical protein [Acidiferrobacterales bacterium]